MSEKSPRRIFSRTASSLSTLSNDWSPPSFADFFFSMALSDNQSATRIRRGGSNGDAIPSFAKLTRLLGGRAKWVDLSFSAVLSDSSRNASDSGYLTKRGTFPFKKHWIKLKVVKRYAAFYLYPLHLTSTSDLYI